MTAAVQTSISPFPGHADLPGVRLWYTDSGGDGVPVLLLHANTGNADSWQYNIPSFAERDFGLSRSIGSTGAAALPPPGGAIVNEELRQLREKTALPNFRAGPWSFEK